MFPPKKANGITGNYKNKAFLESEQKKNGGRIKSPVAHCNRFVELYQKEYTICVL